MRIERLVVEGFGPFAARQEIDFRPLDAAGLFLITGRTGSGKSSLLDAVCFALYGSAPRYDGTASRLRSDHADQQTPTRVELEFAVAGEHWRVVRSPEYERPKKRGEGTTRSPQTATLERLDGDAWVGVAARPVEVAEHLQPVLQLTAEQFLQVILLAQGRFQEFLRATSEQRLSLLRALFGTERFARLEEELTQRARALEASVSGAAAVVRAALGRLGELVESEVPADAGAAWASATTGALAERADAAGAAERAADAAFHAADRGAAQAIALAELQRRRGAARAESARLDSEEPQIEAQRARLDAALRALPVLPTLGALTEAEQAVAAALADRDRALEALGEAVHDPAAHASAADAVLGGLEAPLAEERTLPALGDAAAAADSAVIDAVRARDATFAALAAIPDRRRGLQSQRDAAAQVSARGPEARAAVEQAHAVTAAVQDALRCEAVKLRTESALALALAREQRALLTTRQLIAARIADAAGRLASTLTPQQPCPVCGSTEHPSPASLGADAVDDATLAAAEAAQEAAAGARAAASAEAAEARQALAVARTRAVDRTAEQASAALAEAEARLQDAVDATAQVEAVDRELVRCAEQEVALAAAVRGAEAALEVARAEAVEAQQRHAAAQGRVTVARAEYASVAQRATAVRRRRDLLRDLDRAAQAVAVATQAAADRGAAAAAALADAGFADGSAARAVALPPDQRAALLQAVLRHDAERQVAVATLADPAVALAAEQAADVEGASLAKAAALDARDRAADVRARAAARADEAAQLAESIRATDEAVGAERQQLAVLAPLAAVVKGDGANSKRMRLESFVLAARLEQIVAAANLRLAVMTDGRFALRHDDAVAYRNTRSGLGLEVFDEHTGRARSAASLSGGETFLASLALALGLAEVVSAEAGGVRLDTLFVDEGFGSLDRETLDTAMSTLDSLRAGGRVVGLISHVEAMQEDVPAGLHVERLPDGSSRVRPR